MKIANTPAIPAKLPGLPQPLLRALGLFCTKLHVSAANSLHVLFDLTGLHGLEVDALWDEIHFDIKHSSDIDRLAIVGDRKWQQGMAAFVKPFMKATSRYFDHADIAEARKWLEAAPPLKSK